MEGSQSVLGMLLKSRTLCVTILPTWSAFYITIDWDQLTIDNEVMTERTSFGKWSIAEIFNNHTGSELLS